MKSATIFTRGLVAAIAGVFIRSCGPYILIDQPAFRRAERALLAISPKAVALTTLLAISATQRAAGQVAR